MLAVMAIGGIVLLTILLFLLARHAEAKLKSPKGDTDGAEERTPA
jgi:hypothetical protein